MTFDQQPESTAPLYLDTASAAPVRREALEAAWPYLAGAFGNPSSHHEIGRTSAEALKDARRRVAKVLGMRSTDIVFTSGGTEADNLGIIGMALGADAFTKGSAADGSGGPAPRRHIVTSALEHEAVLASARAHPEVDHLAVEVYRPGLARTIVAAARGGLENVRVVPGDARALVEGALPPESVREVRVFFPDPWPKARHHKRRLVDDAFVAAVTRVLEPGGVLRLATDWQDYADAMRAACEAAPGLESRHPAKPWAPRFEGRVLTRYERKGLDSGREIRDLEFGRPARR